MTETTTPYRPLSEGDLDAIGQWQSTLAAVGDAVGGWGYKADARQTGASVHFKFDQRTDVAQTMQFIEVIHTSPQKLNQVCTRLLAADAENARLRALLAENGVNL